MKGSLIGIGRTAEVYAWGEDQVVKLFRREMPRQLAQREAEIASVVAGAGLHAPAVGGLVEVEDRVGVLYQHMEGPSMLDGILAAMKSGALDDLQAMAQQFADLHAAMHGCTRRQLPAQRDKLTHAITRAPHLSSQDRERVLRLLAGLPDGDAVCHGDYHPGNIVMTPAGAVIIDWLTACRGAPAADVARTMLMQAVAQLPPEYGLAASPAFDAGKKLFFDACLERYRERRPLHEELLEAWMPVMAAARLAEGIENETHLLLALAQA